MTDPNLRQCHRRVLLSTGSSVFMSHIPCIVARQRAILALKVCPSFSLTWVFVKIRDYAVHRISDIFRNFRSSWLMSPNLGLAQTFAIGYLQRSRFQNPNPHCISGVRNARIFYLIYWFYEIIIFFCAKSTYSREP